MAQLFHCAFACAEISINPRPARVFRESIISPLFIGVNDFRCKRIDWQPGARHPQKWTHQAN